MLASVGLADRKHQLARYLSGGERQLLGFLIAQIRSSEVLLLDEPLAALDPAKEQLCLQLIAEIWKAGRTIVQVTHDHAIATSLGNRVIEMADGKVKCATLRASTNLGSTI
jgi:ABC-type nitrate/sulfonate/bicarbonate transport system ATPase subunit